MPRAKEGVAPNCECKRCGWKWFSYLMTHGQVPNQCPRCKSQKWEGEDGLLVKSVRVSRYEPQGPRYEPVEE